jgi:integrase/recombinase XerD
VYVDIARQVREPYATALLLLPLTGLRVDEMCRLKRQNLRFQAPWVLINVSGKSKAERLIPMLRSGNPILSRYLKKVRPKLGLTDWLFPGRNGRPIAPRGMQELVRGIRVRMGLDALTPHTLRHTYATILNRNGITGFDLAAIMGHQNLKTTSLYVHPSLEDLFGKLSDIDTPWLGKDDR